MMRRWQSCLIKLPGRRSENGCTAGGRRHFAARWKEFRCAVPEGVRHSSSSSEVPKGRRKERQGVVVSDKADKTITVRIDIARRHRFYGTVVRSSGTLHAHDENNDANIGDTVRLVESRPLSRTKRWRLTDVLEKAK